MHLARAMAKHTAQIICRQRNRHVLRVFFKRTHSEKKRTHISFHHLAWHANPVIWM
jgi:hypothetical protein